MLSKIYFNRCMLKMVLLGFSSGFPLLLVFNTLSLWLKDAGMSLIFIGVFSLVKIPYSFKWIWSPLVDNIPLWGLAKLGRRRSWALFSQILLMLFICAMAATKPENSPLLLAVFAFMTAFASATQDIVVDAYRIESFNESEQGAGAAVYVVGYRLGLIFSGAFALYLAAFISWNEVYFVMSLGALVGALTILFTKEPKYSKPFVKQQKIGGFIERTKLFFAQSFVAPLKDFGKRQDWLLIILFIVFYKLCDSYLVPMIMPFYDDMGFSKIEIATVSKLYGMAATIIGGLIGGIIVNRIGIMKSLLVCGILQGLSNLIYVAQAYAGHNIYMLMITLSVENLAGGMATTAFVAYLSSLCSVAYTATQYALLTSLTSFSRDVFSATSGYLASAVSWVSFFSISTLLAVPGLVLLVYMIKKYPPKPYKA